MKTKITLLLLCAIMLLSALPFSALAENGRASFSDVKEGAWYENAVKYCCENGYMAGVSKTEFAPNGVMTRAMFVTVLAALSGDDLAKYAKMPAPAFTDVEAGRWYVTAINWALNKGVAAGYGSRFGVSDSLTREQMAVMLRGFYEAYNGKTDCSAPAYNVQLEKYGDAEKVSGWAKDAVKWVSRYDVFGGTATVDGAPYFTPQGTATRAQAAQVIMKYADTNFALDETPIASLTLGGNDISKYKIIYGTTYTEKPKKKLAKTVATELSERIENATGVSLEVLADTEAPEGEYEILIGKTNREDNGTVTVDRAKLKKDSAYISMQGNYLVIASDELQKSTYYAMYSFLEECLGYIVFGGGIEYIAPAKEINVADGYEFIDAPYMELRTSLADGSDDPACRESDSVTFGNMVHTLTSMAQSDYENTDSFHLKYYLSSDPCLSNQYNIQTIIASVRKALDKRPDCDRLWVCQSDTDEYCKCDDCMKIYRVWGRASTYVQIMQFVADAIKDDYPNVKIVCASYKFTHSMYKPSADDAAYADFLKEWKDKKYIPSQSLECPDNVVVCLCTDTACSSHTIDDPNCKNISNNGAKFDEQVQILRKIFKHIYVWYYVDSDDRNYPCPNLGVLYGNYAYFVRNGIEGMYIQGSADFEPLRAFLFGALAWNSKMTKEKYYSYIDTYLKARYGAGWTYIREYINRTSDLMSDGNEWHVWSKAGKFDIISEKQYRENTDALIGLWDKAESLAAYSAEKKAVKADSAPIRNIASSIK